MRCVAKHRKEKFRGCEFIYRPQVYWREEKELINVLKQCGRTKELHFGSVIHQEIYEDLGIVAANVLIEMYMKCGSIEHARCIFDRMTHRNVVSWTCLIQGYVHNGFNSQALDVFSEMCCQPNHVTLLAALGACSGMAKEKDPERDIQSIVNTSTDIHRRLKALHPHARSIAVTNTLIDVYSRCNMMTMARQVFEEMVSKDVVTWTCLIHGYAQNGQSRQALQLFTTMDCQPDHFTYVAVLKACGDPEVCTHTSLTHARLVHETMKRSSSLSQDIHLQTALIHAYCRCGAVGSARDVFESMSFRDVASWNCLIMGYTRAGESTLALDLFFTMDCHPNRLTYLAALNSCIELARERSGGSEEKRESLLRKGMAIHEQIKERGLDPDDDMILACTLIDMYTKLGNMPLASRIFNRPGRRDVATWTCLILGYVDNGDCPSALETFASMDCEPNTITYVAALKACARLGETALTKGLEIHQRMKQRGLESDLLAATALLLMYSACRQMNLARQVFDQMPSKDVVAWNCLIQGYVANGDNRAALNLFFTCMDCNPTPVTYIALIKASAALAALHLGAAIHSHLCRLGIEQDTVVAAALLDLYAKCGCMATATHVFGSINSPDLVSLTVLIAGYGSLGDTSQLIHLAEEIRERGVELDPVAFICILAACSRTGMLDEAVTCFRSMQTHGVSPGVEHYNCLVDVLGRASRVEEAVSVVRTMAGQGNQVTWRSLLAASGRAEELETTRAAFQSLQKHLLLPH